MKSPFLIFFFLLFSFAAKGQWNSEDELKNSRLSVKLNSLPLIDVLSRPAIVIGFEHKLIRNVAMSYEVGTYYWEAQGYLFRTELKYYLNDERKTNGLYTSLAFFIKHQNFNTGDSIQMDPTIYKDFTVTKDVTCLTWKVGMQDYISNRLLLDIYFGLGVRHKMSSSTLTDEENDQIKGKAYNANFLQKKDADKILLNVELGVRIGFSLIK